MMAISRGIRGSRSIDRFMNEHRDQPFVAEFGKLLIAEQILIAERASKLWKLTSADGDLYDKAVSECWYEAFAAQWLGDIGRGAVTASNHNLRVISFNYDRCFELYLQTFLQWKYIGLSAREAIGIVNAVGVMHPYGSLGKLPDFPRPLGDPDAVPFGAPPELAWPVSQGLQTFYESAHSELVREMHGALSVAQRVIFIGFSFEQRNMELLTISGSTGNQSIFATAYKVSPAESRQNIVAIQSMLGRPNSNDIEYADMTAEAFVAHYGGTWR